MASKRLTDIKKWEDEWFSDLSAEHKVMYLYILDMCNNIGVWKCNRRIAQALTGVDIDWKAFEKDMKDRVVKLPNGDWWLKKFVMFHHGILNEDIKQHRSYIKQLKEVGVYKYMEGGLKEVDTTSETPTKEDVRGSEAPYTNITYSNKLYEDTLSMLVDNQERILMVASREGIKTVNKSNYKKTAEKFLNWLMVKDNNLKNKKSNAILSAFSGYLRTTEQGKAQNVISTTSKEETDKLFYE